MVRLATKLRTGACCLVHICKLILHLACDCKKIFSFSYVKGSRYMNESNLDAVRVRSDKKLAARICPKQSFAGEMYISKSHSCYGFVKNRVLYRAHFFPLPELVCSHAQPKCRCR